MNEFPIIVSYYTDDEIYRPAATRLVKSLELFGLEYDVKEIKRFGDFHDHCFYKAKFLLEMLDKHHKAIKELQKLF